MLKVDVQKLAVKYCTDVVDTNIDKAFIQPSLLEWYRSKRRMLPWRGDLTCIPRSAYGTWISEVMLQQTRVETVIEYWNRWMTVFPDVKTLAIATPDEVNKMWAGLGYYRRAQMLLKGAIKVVEDFGGVLPDTTQELLTIPGIGPYTAGAIASIAYDKPEPLVDGNVMRVFSRLLAMKLEVGGGAMEKQCWKVAAELVPSESPGDFNQGLMELGATVCKPTSPDCENCPLSSVCHAKILADHAKLHDSASSAAHTKTAAAGVLELFTKKRKVQGMVDIEDTASGSASLTTTAEASLEELRYDMSLLPRDVAEFPRKVAKKKAKELAYSVCVLRTRSIVDGSVCAADGVDRKPEYRYLFVRRPATGLLANQWEFPSIAVTSEVEEPGAEDTGKEDREGGDGAAVLSATEQWAPFPAYFVDRLQMRWQLGDAVGAHVDSKTNVDGETPANTMLLETQASNDFEPILHIFSHQRHTMHITLRDVQVVAPAPATVDSVTAPVSSKWMTAAEIVEAGITTGCKKILAQVTKTASVNMAKAEKKTAAVVKAPRKASSKVKAEKIGVEQSNEVDVIEIIDDEEELLTAKGHVNVFDRMKKASAKLVAPASKRSRK